MNPQTEDIIKELDSISCYLIDERFFQTRAIVVRAMDKLRRLSANQLPPGEWVKMDDRLPTKADLPIWVYPVTHSPEHRNAVGGPWYNDLPECGVYRHTHWMHCNIPPLPTPAPKSVAERDEEAFRAFLDEASKQRRAVRVDALEAFLAGRRSQRAEGGKP